MKNPIQIWHNNRCGKSRSALKILQEKCLPFEVKNYLENPPSEMELKHVLNLLGIKAHDLIRTGESLYKEKFKGKNHTEKEWITILSENPILIERPIVLCGNKAVVARPPEKVSDIL
jgi:arsenate reductase